jgi:hypothetical protein
MHADLVFVHPKFEMDIIRPLVDHKLGSRLKTQECKNDISEYISRQHQQSPSSNPTDHKNLMDSSIRYSHYSCGKHSLTILVENT